MCLSKEKFLGSLKCVLKPPFFPPFRKGGHRGVQMITDLALKF